ncbi:DNA-binding transcriptional activator of the SARP family [Amycolatopsis marina]|uniref:DNA-binding transcriptional activator of the SARP family n=1 Tax=Amycolatopsis marina TaxID=490629 RepID=A0A1I1B595_9PSEU|nr:BTAD domain-containing putative transcriptional regulator [Amycolatopsis marina]SFB43888.1 DNA-binding transcriptional activator of the SARP family [Amycolatopsis marina]
MTARFRVLGPLEVENEHGPVDLRGPRHQAVLARLLVARGRVVPVTRLIDDLWETPPQGALGALQTFVGALRKALEPDRPPRAPARLLVTVSPGYALRAEQTGVDAWRFENDVVESARLLSGDRAEEARILLDEALGLWRGPAFAEFADEDWARGAATRLDELRLLAVERRAQAALTLGQAAESVPDLQAHVTAHPLREDGWRLLALALYQTGRQGDALSTLRRARSVLRDDLGVDPGENLRRLEADILAQAPHLASRSAVELPNTRTAQVGRTRSAEHPFVGRGPELDELRSAAVAVGSAGMPRLALLSGAAGAGKTALARALTRLLESDGWTTAWGSNPELRGAPGAWPWTRIRASLVSAGHLPEAAGDPVQGASTDDPVSARFHRHNAIASAVATVSAKGPVLLVFDDLHWADEETLALLTALATDSGAGRVLIVATYRSTEISPALAEALGRAARAEPTRIYLSGLAESQVQELVHGVTGREITTADARTIHRRSGGNPFFVRELVRLWEAEGEAALLAVPHGVRDVIRQRLAGLAQAARTHLRQAAVIGEEVDLDVLIALAGAEDPVLDSIEAALLAGFLVEQNADRLTFAHALVYETLYREVPRARRTRWHATIAEILEKVRPGDVEAIAEHNLRAEGRADATRTAHYTRAAAERAEQRFAPHDAARLWRETVAALDRAGSSNGRERLVAAVGMVRALAVTGDLGQARRHRAEAITAAEALGDPVLTAGVIGAFDVPAIWTANDDEVLSARLVAAAERALTTLPTGHDAERARLLITIAMERRGDSSPRGDQAARTAEEIARRLGDPTLLAFALNGRYMHTFHRTGLAPRRARLGAELLDLAGRHDRLVTFEVLGHLILVQARAALADLEAADRHAAAADLLAERYELPLVGVFTDWYAALRLAVTGQADEARRAYRTSASRLAGTGMSGLAEGILPLALLGIRAPTGMTTSMDDDWGPYESWARPLALFAQGDRDQALTALNAMPDSPRDLLLEARLCLHAAAAIQAGDRPRMERLYAELLPAADELAGAGSGLFSLGPTAFHLGRLSSALGRPRHAAEHFRNARSIADRSQSPQWSAAARDALRHLGGQHSGSS